MLTLSKLNQILELRDLHRMGFYVATRGKRNNKSPWQRSLARATLARLSRTRLSNTRVRNCLLPQVHTSNRLKTVTNFFELFLY